MPAHHTGLLLQALAADWGTSRSFHPDPVANPGGSSWVSLFLFAAFAALVVLRVFDGRRLTQLAGGFFRASSVSMLYREENALTGRASLLLIINFLLVTPLFVWQTIGYFSLPQEGMLQYGALALAFVLLYLIKSVATRFMGFVFDKKEAALEYIYNILLFNKTLGLLLFPVTVLLAFAHEIPPEWLVFTGLGLWGIILVYRLFRGILIGLSTSGFSLVYIFLYLCTLEILPFFVILKQFAV
ncbi:MAG: DUF4271 domain-containing protein [Bacteroidetes bacterium]|nr:DUF4271 domain-containing protein [Bacteroidota bacterium]